MKSYSDDIVTTEQHQAKESKQSIWIKVSIGLGIINLVTTGYIAYELIGFFH